MSRGQVNSVWENPTFVQRCLPDIVVPCCLFPKVSSVGWLLLKVYIGQKKLFWGQRSYVPGSVREPEKDPTMSRGQVNSVWENPTFVQRCLPGNVVHCRLFPRVCIACCLLRVQWATKLFARQKLPPIRQISKNCFQDVTKRALYTLINFVQYL